MSDSRTEFEAWCKSRNQDTTRYDRPDPALACGYMNMITHELWVGWDAAWNRRAQPERKLTDAEIIDLHDSMFPRVVFENDVINKNICKFARALLAAQPAAATVPDATFIDEGSMPRKTGNPVMYACDRTGMLMPMRCGDCLCWSQPALKAAQSGRG